MTDERKNIFINTVETLFEIMKDYDGGTIDFTIPDEAIDFFNDYKKGRSSERKEITEKGIAIVLGMRAMGEDWATAAAIGEQIDMSGKSVSGALKKLITDGYAEKVEGKPAMYRLTEKGMNCELPASE